MQAIKEQKKNRKKMLVTASVILLLVIGGTALAYQQKLGPFADNQLSTSEDIDYNEPTTEQVDAGQKVKEQSTSPSTATQKTEATKPSVDSNENTGGSVGVSFDVSGKELKTLIQEKKVDSSGKCTLTLSKSGQKTVTKVADTQISGTVSTCKGFSLSGIASGTWQVKLDYKSNTGSGSSSRSVEI